MIFSLFRILQIPAVCVEYLVFPFSAFEFLTFSNSTNSSCLRRVFSFLAHFRPLIFDLFSHLFELHKFRLSAQSLQVVERVDVVQGVPMKGLQQIAKYSSGYPALHYGSGHVSKDSEIYWNPISLY